MSPDTPTDPESNDSETSRKESESTDSTSLSDRVRGGVANKIYSIKHNTDRWVVGRHLVVVFIAILLTLTPVALAHGAGIQTNTKAPSQSLSLPDCIDSSTTEQGEKGPISANVSRIADGEKIHVEYQIRDDSDSYDGNLFVEIDSPGVSVTNKTGFVRVGSGYVRNGGGISSLTYAVNETNSEEAFKIDRYNSSEDWALAPLPIVDENVNYNIEPDGLVFSDAGRVYFGEIEDTVTGTIGCQTVDLHIPAASPDVDSKKIIERLETSGRQYPIGSRFRSVSGLVVPWNMSTISGYASQNAFFINGTAQSDDISMTALHEYIHTRQNITYSPQMEWVSEAVPSYYMYRLPYQSNTINTADYRTLLYRDYSQSRWGDSFNTTRSKNHYHRGAVTIAALDLRIRNATDGRKSFVHVLRQIYAGNQEVTLPRLKQTVENVSNQSMDKWIEDHIVNGTQISPPVSGQKEFSVVVWGLLHIYAKILEEGLIFVLAAFAVWYASLLLVIYPILRCMYSGISKIPR